MGLLRIILTFFLVLPWTAQAEMGFVGIDAAPAPLQTAAHSILQVVVPGGNILRTFEKNDYKSATFAETLKNAKDQNVHLATQMEFCALNQLPVCQIYDDFIMGTAFIIKDSRHFATNRHIFYQYIENQILFLQERGFSRAKAFALIADKALPVKLVREGKTIASGKKHFASLAWYEDQRLSQISSMDRPEFGAFLSSDITVVSTTETLGEPLSWAGTAPAIGERIYIAGYPVMTTDRKINFGKGDSLGIFKMSIASGVRLPMNEALSRLSVLNSKVASAQKIIAENPDLSDLWGRSIIFNDADSESGASGSPLLNESGHVVGIHSARLVEYRGTLPGLTISLGCILDAALTPQMKVVYVESR